MKFKSLWRFLGSPWLLPSARRKTRPGRSHRRLLEFERLESRDLLAVPRIVAFQPPDVLVPSTPDGSPTISVTYSEDVTGANLPGNYLVTSSGGAPVSVIAVTYVAATRTATLSYSPNPLPVDT